MPLTPNESFAPTQPNEELQRQLTKQKRWHRLGSYVPNEVSLGKRLFYAAAALTWSAWALIGLLSGHMFLLLSRRGPVHFSGPAALIFSCAVLCSVALCVLQIVDHYDRRDNEASYQSARRWLWRLVGAFLVTSVLVGCTQSLFALSPRQLFAGLLSGDRLRGLLTSKWVIDAMRPIASSLESWFYVSGTVLVLSGLLLRLLGFPQNGRTLRPVLAIPLVFLVLVPFLATCTLALVGYIARGEVASDPALTTERVSSQMAWVTSMLVACVGAWLVIIFATVGLVLKMIGGPFRSARTGIKNAQRARTF